jgi:hypothetical protein
MPAIGILAPIFVVVQALISSFVYSEAKRYGSLSALVAGISVFVWGVALAFVLNGALEIVVGELLLILVYLLGQRVGQRRSSAA